MSEAEGRAGFPGPFIKDGNVWQEGVGEASPGCHYRLRPLIRAQHWLLAQGSRGNTGAPRSPTRVAQSIGPRDSLLLKTAFLLLITVKIKQRTYWARFSGAPEKAAWEKNNSRTAQPQAQRQ